MGDTVLYITREVEFAAAHRLYREDYTEARNFEVFGKCANPYGHGHNYLLEVTLKGSPDPETGMILHFSHLNRILQELVTEPLDHRHLNHDVAFMKGILPTSENLVQELWKQLAPSLKAKNFSLESLRLASSPRNWVTFRGPGKEENAV